MNDFLSFCKITHNPGEQKAQDRNHHHDHNLGRSLRSHFLFFSFCENLVVVGEANSRCRRYKFIKLDVFLHALLRELDDETWVVVR